MLNLKPTAAVALRRPDHFSLPGDDRNEESASRLALQMLIVDEDAATRQACAEIAVGLGFVTYTVDSLPQARNVLGQQSIDLLLLDLNLSGNAASILLDEVRTRHSGTAIVVMTAYATVNSAVDALRNRVADYLTKPFELDELTNVLERNARRRNLLRDTRGLRERLRNSRNRMDGLIGEAPEMEKMFRILSKVAGSNHPVLILGESGTGKEVVAHAIHTHGPNAGKPFVPVDCGALVPTLIESELFGHVKGSFTGAIRAKAGLLASADGGTVFLDEIGELPLDLQTKLLRALQEKEVRPVGATHSVPISARVLAATNRDLTAMVTAGRFRKDLYFRLNVVNIRIPPLRERKSDILLLAETFLERVRREHDAQYTFSDEALQLMESYDWPGNVRELAHAIERACALSSGPVLHMNDFPTQVQDQRMHAEQEAAAESRRQQTVTMSGSGVVTIAQMEKQAIHNAIRQFKGDKLMAARMLGIGKTTLYRKLKEYDIEQGAE